MSETTKDSIKRVAIHIHNLEAATKWYVTSFNCEIKWQTTTKALLAFENIELLLLLPSQGRPHLSFEKDNADTFGELFLQEDDSLSCSVSDPSGNIVQLVKR